MTDSARFLDERRALVEGAIAASVPAGRPAGLYDPARYVMEARGKRLRPLLTLLAAEAYGAGPEIALPGAVAVEVFHNFTLVHDDIMDRAESRRGRKTVHVQWDEPTAILVGDLLMGVAYDHVARLPAHALARAFPVFGRCTARLCEGQILDMEFERRTDVTPAEYLDMIERKTGALLACALELGALAAGAPDDALGNLHEAGLEIGRAFQIQDDLLDLTAESEEWGKPVGGDVVEGKRTWLLLEALASVDRAGADRALLERVVRREATFADVPDVRALMERVGVLNRTRQAVIFHTEAALQRLSVLPDGPAREAISGLVRSMQRRIR